MKMKLFTVYISVLLLCFPPAAFSGDRVIDNAGLLGAGERDSLIRLLDSVSLKYNFDLVIVTEKDIGGKSPMAWADDFFDYNGYGLGGDRDGCLFLQVTGSRDYWFSTSGRGIAILNSTALGKLSAGVVKRLGNDDAAGAYRSFIHDWEEFLALDAAGRRYSFLQRWHLVITGAAWLAAFAIGLIVVFVWRAGMNAVLPQTQAAAYMVPGSLSFMDKRDRFLYSTVTKTRRQSQSSGGGSHLGSSGRRHGGGGGKY